MEASGIMWCADHNFYNHTADFVNRKEGKNDDDSENRLEHVSHKDNPELVDDDDDEKDAEKVDEEKGGEMGSLETRTEEMQTPIPTPSRSPRTILSSDKNITQDLTNTKTQKQVNQVLHKGVSQLAKKAIENLFKNNLKSYNAAMIIKDRDAFHSEVQDLVSQEFNVQEPMIIKELFKNYIQSNVIQVHPTTTTSTETASSADLQQQLCFKMKRSLQDQANDEALWEVLKCKFEKYSTSNTSYRVDVIQKYHDDYQEDDAPPKGEKRVKRQKASKSSKSAWGSLSKHSAKDSITYVSKQQQQKEE
nr:hypothetical protein [Tanacetum cinerariifolium]